MLHNAAPAYEPKISLKENFLLLLFYFLKDLLSLVFFEQFYDVMFKDVHSASIHDENGSSFKL